MSGREVFEFRPELINADDEEADDTQYSQEEDEEVTHYTMPLNAFLSYLAFNWFSSFQVEEAEEFSDIDASRFVPLEIDKTGITVSTGFDRKGETHSASIPKEMSNYTDGE